MGTQVHCPIPAHRQAAYRHLPAAAELPITDRAARQVLSLPMYPELPPSDVEYVCASIQAFASGGVGEDSGAVQRRGAEGGVAR